MPEERHKPVKRFIVGKCLFALLVAYLAGTAGAWWWWGRYARRQLQAQLDIAMANGEPLTWQAMRPTPIADDRNAAELYKKAVADEGFQRAMKLEAPASQAAASSSSSLPGSLPGPPEFPETLADQLRKADFRRQHPTELEDFLAQCRGAFALARQARSLKQANYKLDFDSQDPLAGMPRLGLFNELAQALSRASSAAHEAGNDAEAVEYLRDCLAMGDSIDTVPALIGHLVSAAHTRIVAAKVEELSPVLAGGRPGDDNRSEMRELLAELLDDRAFRDGQVLGLVGERNRTGELMLNVWEGRIPSEIQQATVGRHAGFRLLAQPYFDLDRAWALRYVNQTIANARTSNYSQRTPPPDLNSDLAGIKQYGRFLSEMLLPRLGKINVIHYRALAHRRMAATALAIRLYELDNGRRPGKLEELVPNYLPAVPLDPFAAPPGTIVYRPEGGQPVLYCVGVDGRDDGGQFVVRYSRVDEEKLDLPFFLNGDREQIVKQAGPPGNR